MLVLTRKYQEKIRIGNNITITVLRMKGKAVRLGIEAPVDVPVIRGELSFNGESEAVETVATESPEFACAIECELEDNDSPRSGRKFGGRVEIANSWPSDSANVREPAATIEFTRVPRDKVATLLPKVAVGQGPLRAMMSQGNRV